MQLKEISCYALFTICVTATCVQAENHIKETALSEKQTGKRVSKREAAIFVIDSFPGESNIKSKPKVYRRVLKHKYHTAKPSYAPPRNKYRSLSQVNTKKPYKKYKVKKVQTVHFSSAKKRTPKPWTTPSQPFLQSKYRNISPEPSHPSKMPPFTRPQRKPSIIFSPIGQEPMGFAEPPVNYRLKKQSEQDVPVDSYGAPLKPIKNQNLKGSTDPYNSFDNQEPYTAPDEVNWNDESQKDNSVAFSNNYQSVTHPSWFIREAFDDGFNLNNYDPSQMNVLPTENKERTLYADLKKLVNKPWRKPKDEEGKVLVGGQYAEPPGRYVLTHHSNENVLFDDYKYSPGEMDTESTITVSPYVNYKNSNIAFSPQNLNDAFSIDK